MTVQIAIHHAGALEVNFLDQSFRMVYGGLKLPRWELPAAIQVAAGEGTTIVPIDDAVWVQHRDNFEYEILSENLSFLVVRIS